MKIFVWLVFFVAGMLHVSAQSKIDSLNKLLDEEKSDTNRVKLLRALAEEYQVFRPDSALMVSQQALTLAKAMNYLEGESRALAAMANAYNIIGNYPKALQLYIEKIKIEEKRDDPANLAIAYMNIATVYLYQREYHTALINAKKADSILFSNEQKIKGDLYTDLRWTSLLNIGDIYEKSSKLDSAMEFTNRAYRLAVKKQEGAMLGPTLNNLGNICLKNGSIDLAINNYKKGLPYAIEAKDEECICETYLGLAKAYKQTGQIDSSLLYARKSYDLSLADGFRQRNLDASIFLHDYYKGKGNIDSAYKYQTQMVSIKDSIQSASRIKEAQIISIDEQLRQKELFDLRQKEKAELNKRLQFLAVGIMVPILFLFIIYFRGQKVKPRLVENLGVISLLLFFECISLLLHPTVVELTHHIPLFELLVFVIIAAILSRSHHWIEHWVLRRLTNKRERINDIR